MGKRSQKLPVRYEKDSSGCMSGLISMFDFRQGRPTQRLLSDRRRSSRHEAGAGNLRNKLATLTYPNEDCSETDGEEKITALADVSKPSVKKLIEEEMFGEQNNGEVEPKQSNSENGSNKKKNHKRIKKIRSRSCDSIRELDVTEKPGLECPCHQSSLQRSGNSLNLENVMEQFCRQMHEKRTQDHPAEANDQTSADVAEKLSEAIKLLISQKLLDRVDGDNIHTSEELMDFLHELTNDEELFLKFSQDPNSLLTKYMKSERDNNQVEEDEDTKSLSGFSDGELSTLGRSDKLVSHKRLNFFKRKVKYQGSNEETSQSSNKIVILKPGPTALSSHHVSQGSGKIIMNKEPSERVRSIFFLAELKRRLKNAMGKEHHRAPSDILSASDYDGSFKESSGRNSTTKEHFFVERIARPSSIGVKKGEKLKGREIGRDYNSMPHPIQRVSNIYVEAKKHLSEMLSNGDDEDQVKSGKQLPKTLGRILLLPEYNSSPVESPGKKWNCEHSFVTAQMRFATYEKNENVNEDAEPSSAKQDDNVNNPTSQTTQNLEPQQPCVTDEAIDVEVHVFDSTTHCDEAGDSTDKTSSGGDMQIVEVTEIVLEEAFDTHSGQGGSSNSSLEDQTKDSSEVVDEQRDSACMDVDCYEENKSLAFPLGSPSNSSIGKKGEDYESTADILERPSPVSVLDSLFMDDDISPASNRSQSADAPIRSLQIHFEEFDFLVVEQPFSKNGTEGNKSIFEFVEAVVQASGLNCDDLYVMSISSDQLLDPSLIGRVEFLPDHDQTKLLFDCINEILVEVHEHYFGCSPWVSFIKPNIRTLPSMNHVVCEVSQGVNWHIIPLPLPRTLDQIVRKDMAKSGSWMDVRLDTGSIGREMGEIILEDLMEDAILSCVIQHEQNDSPINLTELEENQSGMEQQSESSLGTIRQHFSDRTREPCRYH